MVSISAKNEIYYEYFSMLTATELAKNVGLYKKIGISKKLPKILKVCYFELTLIYNDLELCLL